MLKNPVRANLNLSGKPLNRATACECLLCFLKSAQVAAQVTATANLVSVNLAPRLEAA